MDLVQSFLKSLNGFLWGPPMLILLFGTHLYLTFRLKFIQRFIGLAIKLSFARDKRGEGEISHFGALATALAATVGTGNIVGVATAVALGGPGAILWMWLTGVFGIATKYAEALLSVKYRQKTPDGRLYGGPMYVLEKALNLKWLAILFAAFTAIAAFGIGNMVQSNAIATMAKETFAMPTWLTAVIVAGLAAAVILGGLRAIARVCVAITPFMVITYVLGCLIILGLNWNFIGPAMALIVSHAVSGKAAAGGFTGATLMVVMRYGIARGLFSNESGMGSAPIVAATARTKNPVRQALVSASGTFWDTVVICAITGLVLVTSIMRHPEGMEGLNGAMLTQAAFSQIPVMGPIILTLGLATFVFSTILGWSYYGESAVQYLFGNKVILPYRLMWIGAIVLGGLITLPLVWDFADAMNAFMVIPNLVSLLLLNGVIVTETRKYLWRKGIDQPVNQENKNI